MVLLDRCLNGLVMANKPSKRAIRTPLRLDPWQGQGKYVPVPVDAILTDAETKALEILLYKSRPVTRHEGKTFHSTKDDTGR
jgi:hypothetical protein